MKIKHKMIHSISGSTL